MSRFTYVTTLHGALYHHTYQHWLSLGQRYQPSNHLTDKSFARELLWRVAFIFVAWKRENFEILSNAQKQKTIEFLLKIWFHAMLINRCFNINDYAFIGSREYKKYILLIIKIIVKNQKFKSRLNDEKS